MATFRIMPSQTLRISDLKDRSKEALVKQFDRGSKGYLTTNEAYALFASQNRDVQPKSMDEVVKFLGGAEHQMTVFNLDHNAVLAMPFSVHDWKGDFNVPDFGAGHVLVGGYYNWDRPEDPRAAAVLINLNLVDMQKAEKGLNAASLIIGPMGFKPEDGSSLPDEAVEVPLTLATLEGHQRWERTGSGWQHEQKYLAAAIDVEDLLALSNGRGVSMYVKLETAAGPRHINRDGAPGQNFDTTHDELKRYAGV
jgi:hypothetical protein